MNDDFYNGLNGIPGTSLDSAIGMSIYAENQTRQALKTQAENHASMLQNMSATTGLSTSSTNYSSNWKSDWS